MNGSRFQFERWTRRLRTVWTAAVVLAACAAAPLFLPATMVEKLTTLWIYILLAVVWNLLAGFAGLFRSASRPSSASAPILTLRLVEWVSTHGSR